MTHTSSARPALDLTIVDTTVSRSTDGHLVWFAVGALSPLQSAAGSPVDPVDLGTRMARADRDASFALIDQRDPRSPVLHLWRGLLSVHDWFIANRSDGRTIVSDDFRSALAALPVADRVPGDDAVVQHYLFRTVYGTSTYVERIRRLGAGEHVMIDIASGERSAEIVDRISSESDLVGPERYVSVVEDALEGIMADLGTRPGVRLSFSGGVDSTLLATFMSPDQRLLTVVPDTAEFAVETTYARESADLLGMSIEEVAVSEASYVDLLEATIDDTALPPVHDVIPFLATAYNAHYGSVFIIGEGADGVFGTGGRAAKVGNLFRQRHVRAVALGLTRATPERIRFRAQSVIGRGRYFASDPESADGLAAAFQVYGDPGFITGVVGADRIERILLSDLEYALDRVDLVSPSDPFLRQIEIRQWRSMFNDHFRIDREAARVHGTDVVAPFLRSPAISALTRIPIADRHHKGFTGKWLLKDLLAARLPTYDVAQRKRHTSLPFTRFCTDGPLIDIWDRYTPPSLFENEAKRDLIANELDEAVLWNAIAYAMWDERVLQNSTLKPLPASESISIDLKLLGETGQLQ
jgi:asparagine synthetase B (glutamine-hydrolysing)